MISDVSDEKLSLHSCSLHF